MKPSSEDELVASMLAHSEETHWVFEGKSPDEVQQTEAMMDTHLRRAIADEN